MTRFNLQIIALALFFVAFTPQTLCEDIETDVLILGGGVSGIIAAETLLSNGVENFIVLEGDGEIGGRLKSTDFHGLRINLGANWVHFADNDANVMWRIKEDYNISGGFSNYDNIVMYHENGTEVDEDEMNRAYEKLYRAQVVSEYELYAAMKNCGGSCIKDMSVRSGLKFGGWDPETPVEMNIEYFEYDAEYGDDPDTTSLNTTLYLFEDNTEDDYFVSDPRGFDVFLHEIAETFPAGAVKLNKVVKVVDWASLDGVVVHTADGDTYTAKHALCTFSVGVLESDEVQFRPKMPDWKLAELYKFRMAWFTKIFLKFPAQFWADNEWIMYASTRRGYYPAFSNLQATGLFPEDTNLLLLFVIGDESRRIENQDDEETKEEIMAVLKTIYGDEIPSPDDIYVTKWGLDPFQRGSFSNWPPEVSEDCFKRLQAPLNHLHFAGEATHEKYNGYLQGAYITGRDQAQLILQKMHGTGEGH